MTRYPSYETTFIRVVTDAGANITVTPDHYLFALPASQLPATAAISLRAWRYTLPTQVCVRLSGATDAGTAAVPLAPGTAEGSAAHRDLCQPLALSSAPLSACPLAAQCHMGVCLCW